MNEDTWPDSAVPLTAELRALVAKHLVSLDIVPCTIPKSGLYLWCQPPGGLESTGIARKALTHEVVLAPGNACSLSRAFSDYMRFNAAQTHHESVYTAVEPSISQIRHDQLD